MTADAIVAISAAVVACVQMLKWAGIRDSWGPIAVILFSGLGVGIWLFSQSIWPPERTDTWPIFAGWISIALSSAGVFGFTRAGAGAITRATAPPTDGAGSSVTVDQPIDGSQMSAEKIADVLERRRQDRIDARLREVSENRQSLTPTAGGATEGGGGAHPRAVVVLDTLEGGPR